MGGSHTRPDRLTTRQTAVSLCLNDDVPAPEAAPRTGIHTKCIDGQENVNQRMADVLTA